MKICITCKDEKGLENFGLRKDNRPVSECKKCSAERSNRWYWENREKSIDDRKKRYQNTREKTLEQCKKYYEENRERIRKRANERNRTPEERAKSNKRSKEWNRKNPEKLKKKCREWKSKNKEKAMAHQYVLWALRLNVILKPIECSLCKKKIKLEAHHKDYSKPLDVEWLCKLCHELRHHYDDSKG
jgi:hypothetical protein